MTEFDLYSARKATGMSQGDVAKALGVSQTAVSAWERGRNDIAPGQVIAYAKAIGVSVSRLIVGALGQDDYEDAYWSGWNDCAAAVRAVVNTRGIET